MRLTTKTRYAINALLDICLFNTSKAVSLRDISMRQNISISYLEQLFLKLRRNNIVKSVRGAKGGYQLNVSPNELKLWDVVVAIDDKIDATQCDGQRNCYHGEPCLAHNLWVQINNSIQNFLYGVTLQDLVQMQDKEQINKIKVDFVKKSRLIYSDKLREAL